MATVAERSWVLPGAEPSVDTRVNPDVLTGNVSSEAGLPFDFIPSNEAEMRLALADPMWRLCSGQLYKIMVKSAAIARAGALAHGIEPAEDEEATVIPFRPNRAQRRFISHLWHRNIILKARQLGFCVAPETRILTAGLQWAPIAEVAPGTEIVAADEHPPGPDKSRRMRKATVLAVEHMQAERWRISFDGGKRSVICTDRHPWLAQGLWRSISGEGNCVAGPLKVGSRMRQIAWPPWTPTAEWLQDGRRLPGGWSSVTDIEPIGIGPVVDMQTSTGTYIAEGFVSHNTTLVSLMWLDHALFNSDQRCGVIAQDRETAESIFRDKVKLAYERLPAAILAMCPLKRDSTVELLFGHNNSSIRVATSVRGGTIHRLLVSEFGRIGADDPGKANEIVTGSLPAVPADGIAIIESTAAGQEGEFYKMTMTAMAAHQSGTELTEKAFRFHFFPWWQESGYRISTPVIVTDKDREYFNAVEAEIGRTLDHQQRQWYVATRDAEYSGDPEKMWSEYPSTAKEAFAVSTEGVYYAQQLADARKGGRICNVPHLTGIPVNTYWDIGSTDGTAIWLMQEVGMATHVIGFIEGWNEPYSYYIKLLQDRGYVWGTHNLPHDAGHKRQQGSKVCSPEDELRAFKIGGTWRVLDAVDDVQHGIQATRAAFNTLAFDEERTKPGVIHLAAYRKTWNKARGGWNGNVPSKIEGHSEAADALRQWGQSYRPPRIIIPRAAANRNWRVA